MAKRRATDPDELLIVEQVSHILHVHPQTTYRRLRRGAIPHVRDGRMIRVRRVDLEAYIAARTQARLQPYRRPAQEPAA